MVRTRHTKGDELIFVEPDSVLLPGDIVENKLVPTMPTPTRAPKVGWRSWTRLSRCIRATWFRIMVSWETSRLSAGERSFLADLQQRALELKRGGTPVGDAGAAVDD